MPGWQRMVAPLIAAKKLKVVGVVQEQHPDRARLYRQWRKLPFPLAVDALNTLDYRVVPVLTLLDENGVVIGGRRGIAKLIDRAPVKATRHPQPATKPEPAALKKAGRWRDLGDALFLFGKAEDLDGAVDAYAKAVKASPADGRARFRLGVALRRRSEGAHAKAGDAQAAVDRWGEALATNPNQYIWRRRIQQYGPRLAKPYNFYFWVAEARKAIVARGEKPVPLTSEPRGSEIAAPRRGGPTGPVAIPNNDKQGKINRDKTRLIGVETIVTPSRVRPGHRVRVRVRFRVNPKTRPYWNNEADGLEMSIALEGGVVLDEGRFSHAQPKQPETREERTLELELKIPEGATGTIELPGYALYDVCEDKAGVCRRLRQDFKLRIVVDPKAPKIQ